MDYDVQDSISDRVVLGEDGMNLGFIIFPVACSCCRSAYVGVTACVPNQVGEFDSRVHIRYEQPEGKGVGWRRW